MSSGNGFLKDFMNLRKSLQPSLTSPGKMVTPTSGSAEPPKKKGGRPSKQTPLTQSPEGSTTLAKIVEEKPKRSVVEDYLQNRANEETVKKMNS